MTRMLKIFMAALVGLSLIGGASALAAESLVVNGSTTVLPIGQATAEAYMKKNPDVNISLSGGGSGDGIKALIDKSTQIAMSSREMKKEEIELAKSKGVNPVEHKVAIDALTPIVHPRNPVKNLTIEQLTQIYQGKITNWKEVGGKDLQIVVISRDTSSGTYESWQEKILHKEKVTPEGPAPGLERRHCPGRLQEPLRHRLYRDRLHQQERQGPHGQRHRANDENALNGTYPIARPLYMYTNGKPRATVAKYLNFVKGPEGQKIVKKDGFVPPVMRNAVSKDRNNPSAIVSKEEAVRVNPFAALQSI